MSANQYLKRAVELAQGGDNKSALAEVKRALEIEPDHPKGLIFRFTLEARLLRRAQRPGEAAVRYRAVLALDPENSEAKKMLREEQPAHTPSGAFPSGAGVAGDQKTGEATIHRANVRSKQGAPDAAAAPAAQAQERPRKAPGQERAAPAESPRTRGLAAARAPAPHRAAEAARAAADVAAPGPAPFEETELPPPSVETPLEPERRVAPRVSVEVDVGISSESNFFAGFSGDISEGGLFVATYNVLPVGATIEVSFGILGHEVRTEAVVCWIREPIDINLMPGFGVRFMKLSSADHNAIAHFIATRAPMFFDDE